MRTVAFSGSPRKDGNIEMPINEVFKPIQEADIETELVQLGGRLLRGCTPCHTCFKTKDRQCVIKTDPMNKLIRKAQETDGIILASPTYYGNMSTGTKALMDRSGLTTIGQGRTLTRKVGVAAINVRRGGVVTVYNELNRFMLGSGVTVLGSIYWNFGTDEVSGEVYDDVEGSRNTKDLGVQLAWLLEAIHDK